MTKKNNKAIQIRPADEIKIYINNLAQKVFETEFPANSTITKSLTESNRKGVVSTIQISNSNNEDIDLTEFDRAVLDICLSEKAKGNEYTTAKIIFHQLGGGYVLTPNMRKAILESVEKLANIRVKIETDDACKKNIVKPINGKFKLVGYLLPTESMEVTLGGTELDSIHFLSNGVVFTDAERRNQIVSCPLKLLQAPIKSTPRNIAANHYLLRRALTIKGSNENAKNNKRIKPLSKSILIDDLYKCCGIDKENKWQCQDIRNIATKILNYLVEFKIIKNFHFEKRKSRFYSITIEIFQD